MIKLRKGICFILLQLTAISCFAAPYKDYEDLKTVYVYQMINFINWKDESFKKIQICSFGIKLTDDSISYLESRNIRNKPISVKKILEIKPDDNCQVLLVQKGYFGFIDKDLIKASKSMLIIGEDNNFLEQGGHIAFKRKNQKLKFDINLAAVKKSLIHVNSSLLEVADNVIQ